MTGGTGARMSAWARRIAAHHSASVMRLRCIFVLQCWAAFSVASELMPLRRLIAFHEVGKIVGRRRHHRRRR